MCKITLFLFLLFSFIYGLAQEKFETGKLYLQNDTLEGFIHIDKSLIKYREIPNGRTNVYKGDKVKKADYLNYDVIPLKINNQYIFCIRGVEGQVSVYYAPGIKETPIILKKNGQFTFLRNETNSFRGKIIDFFSDCPEAVRKAEKSAYKLRELTKIANVYNKCKTGEKSDYYYKENLFAFNYGLFLGNSFSKHKYQGEKYPFLSNTNFKDNFSPVVGFSFEISQRKLKKISLVNELLFMHNNFSDEVNQYDEFDNFHRNTYKYSVLYLRLNTLFRVYLFNAEYKPYLNFGMTNSLPLVFKQSREFEVTNINGDTNNDEEDIFNDLKATEHGFAFGAGLFYKNCCLSFLFDINGSFVSESGLSSFYRNIYINFGYCFN